MAWSLTGPKLHGHGSLAHSLTGAHTMGCNGRLPTWHRRKRNGPFTRARYQGFLPAGSQFQPYHLTCSGSSHPMLVYFFLFLGFSYLHAILAVPSLLSLLTPRVSKGFHNVPVRPRR